MAVSENKQKMLNGELYYAFTPELNAARARCKHACARYNNAGEVSRRRLVELWRDITQDETPLPPQASTPEEDDKLFKDDPWVEPSVKLDYGFNVSLGKNVFVNFNSVFLDTCRITIGSRTLVGPNVSFFAATHPLDPVVRKGTAGPEAGKEIHVGEDCWIGGNVVILPGVSIGKGSVVGAGSVVTRDVPAFTVVVGNPAKILKKIETAMDPAQSGSEWKGWPGDHTEGAEVPMAAMVEEDEGIQTQEDVRQRATTQHG
ncbi:maltose O-acetyltransferas-like protein [Delitschia confertaspora ATCC 74209]|uniref:Maltose O-acetyltransferas-like protein n=1 Tax=Delitschia confertaspora ATCC 74209 TaxID=1513339 RepID=A0A9P4JXE3_9PLEO|nr:maltose O-acetyltransferas-like protein [Delitschia confertaspora ATCC 74209]